MTQKPNLLTIYFRRFKQLIKVLCVLVTAFRTAHRIGALQAKEPLRDILPKYIQVCSRKLGEAFNIKVVPIADVPKTHGLWVANHISWMDITAVGSVSPVFFLSKAEVAKFPIIGKLARVAGTLFIKRGSGDAGSVSQQIAEFLQSGSSVVFFPEATTTRGHRMKNIHGKLLQASIDTGLPIQPMVTCYADEFGNISDDIAYYGDISLLESLIRVMDSQNITAYVLPLEPLYPQENQKLDEITDILAERMQTGLIQLQKQVLTSKPEEAIWD